MTVAPDDDEFEAGGGLAFADEVAEGLQRRIDETLGYGLRGVTVNAIEMLWLVAGYRRLRAAEARPFQQHQEQHTWDLTPRSTRSPSATTRP